MTVHCVKGGWKPEYGLRYRQKYPEKVLCTTAKARAKKKNVPFNITKDDIYIPEICPILNVKMQSKSGSNGGGPFSPSLDRIVPELGYVPGNIRVISLLANNMKSSANNQQLITFANWVKENIHDSSLCSA
jgi:hypothetical protein